MAKVKEEVKKNKKAAEQTAKAVDLENKKVEADGEFSEEQLQYARINMRRQFNKRFSKWAELEPEDADDAYIEEAKKDLDTEVEVHKNEVFKIADAADGVALNSAIFLRDWNRDFNAWEKGEWKGLVKFDEVISKLIEELQNDSEKNFCIDYATLIFLYNTMMKPSGVGIESAKKMAKYENYDIVNDKEGEVPDNPITYSGLLSRIIEHVKYLSAVDKKLNILKQRLQLAYGGLRMKLKISSLEEFIEFNDSITSENLPTDDEIEESAKN